MAVHIVFKMGIVNMESRRK